MSKLVPPNFDLIKPEIKVKTSRSSGPGGQHVNKVETKVTLQWFVEESEVIDEKQSQVISTKLSNKITKEGVIQIVCETKRSQLENKRIAFNKIKKLILSCFENKKARILTKPTKTSQKKRLDSKKIHSDKKAMRKKIL